MPLPTTLSPSAPGHIGDHEEIHGILDDIQPSFGITQFKQGSYSGIGAAGNAGRFFYATDVALLFFDTGAAWKPIGVRHQVDVAVASSSPAMTTNPSTLPSVSIGLTTVLASAIYIANFQCDFVVDTTALPANLYMIGEVYVDGVAQGGQAILQDNGASTRATCPGLASGTLAAGAHTFEVRVHKTAGTGAHTSGGSHSKLVVDVFEGQVT